MIPKETIDQLNAMSPRNRGKSLGIYCTEHQQTPPTEPAPEGFTWTTIGDGTLMVLGNPDTDPLVANHMQDTWWLLADDLILADHSI